MNSFMSDPNAEELLQRHKIQSQINNSSSHSSFSIDSNANAGNSSAHMASAYNSIMPHTPTKVKASVISPKEYVESLHQNFKTQLIYGKNNVLVKKVN